jgi:large subunit ribosomal protein L21
MYAIVDIAGQQYKVSKDQKVFVHRLEASEGAQVDFTHVLLIDNDTNVTVGAPAIEGAMVSARILTHLKGDKVLVFKKKRRKGYQKLNGHRQYLTQLLIEEIVEKGAKPRVAEKVKAAPAEQKAEVKAEAPVVVKEKAAPAPKAAAAKPAAKTAPKASLAKSEKPAAEKKTAAKAAKPAAAKSAAPKKAAAPKKSTPKAK